ncbi:hypothetical protein P154DRAFT_516864 [Amniculicola lignicola CBS 123094]|uniref:Uncharacterized protein n=1 Tax=Amniculicola lignicola CBS 123094 TaxID=1392246 RepID=A0A6A5X598_9PLEO|nr:hypothetical protein P154DRAFT_516864 [Amniculicola lignicola CBS 123094]
MAGQFSGVPSPEADHDDNTSDWLLPALDFNPQEEFEGHLNPDYENIPCENPDIFSTFTLMTAEECVVTSQQIQSGTMQEAETVDGNLLDNWHPVRKEIVVSLDNDLATPKRQVKRLFPCPVFVADTIMNRPHSCNGAEEKSMSDLRRHMTRGVRRRPHLSFLKLCRTCNEHILDKTEFREFHDLKCHNFRKQRRGADQERLWKELYRKVLSEPSNQASRPPHQLFATRHLSTTMAPPTVTQLPYNEGDIFLAISVINQNQIQSKREAVQIPCFIA